VFDLVKRLRRRRDHKAATVPSAVEQGPTSLVGQWLSAGVLRQGERRRALRAKLRASGWHDADAVAKAAFEIAVREAYSPGWVPAPPEEMAAGMRTFFGTDGVDRVPQDEAVELIRAALGEQAETDRIPAGIAFMVHGLVFVGLAWDLQYDRTKLHAVLRQAEDIARGRGHTPTTADELGPQL
jgi:hypothetical protein